MSFDVQFTFVMIAVVVGLTTCGVADKCESAADHRANAEVRKACVYKTGNPECKR